jgi:hypothetical protein
MSGKGDFNLDEFWKKLGGEHVVSIPGSNADSRADPERTPEPLTKGEWSPLVPLEKEDAADYPPEGSQSCMKELLSDYTINELLQRKKNLYDYGDFFADFTKNREITQNLHNFEKNFGDFDLPEQIIILEINLKRFAQEIIEYGRKYGDLFLFEESLYNNLSTEKQLEYLFKLCNKVCVENSLILLKAIIKQAIQKYGQHKKDCYIFQTESAMYSAPIRVRVEENYLDKLSTLINESKSSVEVFHSLGFFYNFILPIQISLDFKEIIGEYSFMAFFIQEIMEAKTVNPEVSFSVFLLEGIIKDQALKTDRKELVTFELPYFDDYHSRLAEPIREKCLKALSILNNPVITENFQKKLKEKEEEEFVFVGKGEVEELRKGKGFF